MSSIWCVTLIKLPLRPPKWKIKATANDKCTPIGVQWMCITRVSFLPTLHKISCLLLEHVGCWAQEKAAQDSWSGRFIKQDESSQKTKKLNTCKGLISNGSSKPESRIQILNWDLLENNIQTEDDLYPSIYKSRKYFFFASEGEVILPNVSKLCNYLQQMQGLEKITSISQFPNYKAQLWH